MNIKPLNGCSYFLYAGIPAEEFKSLQSHLLSLKYKRQLEQVKDGFELIRYLQNIGKGDTYPDLIIVSRHLLRLDAKETMELVKSDDIYKLIPCLIFLNPDESADQSFFQSLGVEVILLGSSPRSQQVKAALATWEA